MYTDGICVFIHKKKHGIRELWAEANDAFSPLQWGSDAGEKQVKHPLICQTNMQEAQQGVEHRVTEREWVGEERTRLLRRADKGAITRSLREAESEGPVLKTSATVDGAVRQQVNAAYYSRLFNTLVSSIFFRSTWTVDVIASCTSGFLIIWKDTISDKYVSNWDFLTSFSPWREACLISLWTSASVSPDNSPALASVYTLACLL